MASTARGYADGPGGLTDSEWGKTVREELASLIIEQHEREIEALYKVWEAVQREMLPDDVAAEVVRLKSWLTASRLLHHLGGL